MFGRAANSAAANPSAANVSDQVPGAISKSSETGSAGSGSGYGGKMAELPQGVDKAKTPQEIELAAVTPTQQSMSPLLKARQIEALKGPAPVCEVCEEAKGN